MIVDISSIIKILNSDGIAAIPTETVYGLAGSIKSTKALEKIFAVKKRPFFDPLIVHVSDIDMAKGLTTLWPEYADKLAKEFWPGPLTMVLPKNNQVKDIITAGLDHVGIRIPNHELALNVIKEVGPLAAPSANIFSHTSPTCASHVQEEFQEQIDVLDGGECSVGIESTVIGIFEKQVKIYRPGMIEKDHLKKVIGEEVYIEYTPSPVAPGQIKHHYMPKIPLAITPEKEMIPQELSAKKLSYWQIDLEPQIVARTLYSKMRSLDNDSEAMVFIISKENFQSEKWTAIRNRLEKAATYNLMK